MKTLNETADTAARTPARGELWRATGLEAPVFEDLSGRRALTMSGIGLVMAAATLAALVIVVTAAIGFTSVPSSLAWHVPPALTAQTTDAARRADRPRLAGVIHVYAGFNGRVSDAVADRRSHT
jgi:hypothetical protein